MLLIDYVMKFSNEIEESLENARFCKFVEKALIFALWRHSVYQRAYVFYLNDFINVKQYKYIVDWVENSELKDFIKGEK